LAFACFALLLTLFVAQLVLEYSIICGQNRSDFVRDFPCLAEVSLRFYKIHHFCIASVLEDNCSAANLSCHVEMLQPYASFEKVLVSHQLFHIFALPPQTHVHVPRACPLLKPKSCLILPPVVAWQASSA